jgi:hypothetical protein
MKRTKLNSRGFIQVVALMGGLAVIAGILESSRLVNAGRQQALIEDLAKMEGYYVAEMAAVKSLYTARAGGNFNDRTAVIPGFVNSYEGMRRTQVSANLAENVWGLNRTSAMDSGRTLSRGVTSLSESVINTAFNRNFCGNAQMTYASGGQTMCLSQGVCPATIPVACYDIEPVAEVYRSVMGREPSVAEGQADVNSIISGTMTITDIQNALRSSAEYLAHAPTTCNGGGLTYTAAERGIASSNVEEIIALYRTFLGRLPRFATNEHFPFVEALTGCGAIAAQPIDAVVAQFKALPEFTNPVDNNSTLHAEAIRELYLRLYGRDPLSANNGFAASPNDMMAWLGLLTGEVADPSGTPAMGLAVVSVAPGNPKGYNPVTGELLSNVLVRVNGSGPFSSGPVPPIPPNAPMPFVAPRSGLGVVSVDPGNNAAEANPLPNVGVPVNAGGTFASVPRPAGTTMLWSEVESNPLPRRAATLPGMTDGGGLIDVGQGYVEAAGYSGELMTSLFRMMLGRSPVGPYPRVEVDYFQQLMSSPLNASNAYVTQMLQASREFNTRGPGCGCQALPTPVCRMTAPKTTIVPGEDLTVTLSVFPNNPVDAANNLDITPIDPTWNGVAPPGSITSVFWGANQTVGSGVRTYTRTITGSSGGGTTQREEATVAGPGGTSTCALDIHVQSTSVSCNIHMLKRGPGARSSWAFGRWPGVNNYPNTAWNLGGTIRPNDFYSLWQVFIPARPVADFQWGTNFRFGAGYWYVGPSVAVLSGDHDPCNRIVGACPPVTPMPATYTHLGVTYQLMTRLSDGTPQPYMNGGICGSPDCLCYLSGVVSPLAIDFVGKGIRVQPGVEFDMGQGKKDHFWLKDPSNVAFLTLDRDASGKIEDYNELFGSATVGPNGKAEKNGFEALRLYDVNKDKSIDPHDSVYGYLRVWFDRNRNGVSEPDELSTLDEVGIDKISLFYEDRSERIDNYGNEVRQVSYVQLKDGSHRRIVDVWLAEGNPNEKKIAKLQKK